MKKYLLIIPIFLMFAIPAQAANTQGYAWSESVGWFDFSNTEVSDTNITGYAYNDNTGWLVMDGVSNTDGQLSGYAWSESVGYFDFSNTTISNGAFSGYAYNDNTGWLSFEDGTNVTTTWAPQTRRITSSGSRSTQKQQTPSTIITPTTPIPTTPPTLPPAPNTPRDLELNNTGPDVKLLQILLNLLGYNPALSGPGSLGNETEYFGNLTRLALARFQLENNVTPAVGYYGPLTRTAILEYLINKFTNN